MKANKLLIFIFTIVLLSGLVSADNENFVAGSVTEKNTASYQNGAATMKVLITSLNSECDLTCTWSSPDDNGGPFLLGPGENEGIEFVSNARSNQGSVSGTFTIICTETSFCPGPSEATENRGFSHSYPYLGDNQCLTDNNYESCISAIQDCSCGQGKSCINDKGDQSRNVDDRKCATWCGNGIKESTYETCSSCPTDVGQCDGYNGCVSGSECEGGFCVHEVCASKPYIERDNFCDFEEGENCKNSADCGCLSNEICTNTGICQKEEASKGKIQEAVQSGVQETLKATQGKQKNITLIAIILIILVIVGYIIFKVIKSKGSKAEPKKEVNHKERLATLQKQIKEHQDKIKELKKQGSGSEKSPTAKKKR